MLTLVAAAFAADQAGLILTAYVLQGIGAASLIVAVVIFRDEIRRGLGRASPLRWWRERRRARRDGAAGGDPPPIWGALADGLFELARKRIGALVVVPRRDPIAEHVTGGVRIDAAISTPLLEAIFHTGSPVHDGAAVIDGERVGTCAAFLPLSSQPELPDRYGTRHRAAVGISERCDAIALCVSEQRGEISLAVGGKLVAQPASATALAQRVGELVAEAEEPERERVGGERRRRERRRRLARDAVVAIVIFGAVLFAWFRIAHLEAR
jgi:DNA integrity scanning protein DisA with diadenylate cyclase activity